MHDLDDTLTRLIADADPLPNADDPAVADRAWAVVAAELAEDPAVTPMRRPSRLRRAGVVGAVAVVALAASAGTVYIATRTGEQNPPEWVSAGGPGEEYRLDGTDFAAELAKLATDIPFPDDVARQAALKAIVADLTGGDEPAVASTGALRAELARSSICTWTIAWQDADATGRDAATAALRGALSWPAVTDVDPKPAIDGDQTDFGTGPTVFGHLPGIVDAAASGDEARLEEAVDESAYCAVLTRPDRGQPAPAPAGEPAAQPRPTTVP